MFRNNKQHVGRECVNAWKKADFDGFIGRLQAGQSRTEVPDTVDVNLYTYMFQNARKTIS